MFYSPDEFKSKVVSFYVSWLGRKSAKLIAQDCLNEILVNFYIHIFIFFRSKIYFIIYLSKMIRVRNTMLSMLKSRSFLSLTTILFVRVLSNSTQSSVMHIWIQRKEGNKCRVSKMELNFKSGYMEKVRNWMIVLRVNFVELFN